MLNTCNCKISILSKYQALYHNLKVSISINLYDIRFPNSDAIGLKKEIPTTKSSF
jgi:hypothetical protein